MTRLFKAAAISLALAFALPALTTSASAAEKTQMKKHKAKQQSPCGKEGCMKAVPAK